jgi:hypothetical protein
MLGVVHMHSDWSHDGRDSLAALRRFALERGIGFVGMTDHAEDFDAARYEAYRAECAAQSDDAVRIIPGLEFRFAGHRGLHLLAFGLERFIEPATPEEFMRLAPPLCELTMMAHPRLARYALPDAVAAGIDAIEVWNAAYDTRFLPDPRAFRLLREVRARRPQVVAVAGLDQHDARNDRETRVRVAADAADRPLAAIKAGRFAPFGRTLAFDALTPPAGWWMAGLYGARAVLDGVNGVHERVMRFRRRRARAARPKAPAQPEGVS